jgi:hypothetical protein
MYMIASVEQLRQRLGLGSGDSGEDGRLSAALQAASAQIEAAAGRRFLPRRAVIAHTIHPRHPAQLLLADDLLELETLVNGDGSSIELGQVMAVPDAPDGVTGVLRLRPGQVFTWVDTPLNAAQVGGVWGYHDRWSQAWRDSADTVQDDPLSAGATTISVSDADGGTPDGIAPRFQVGQLIRLGDEYAMVTGVDSATDTLTVRRGVNGTAAASHPAGTLIGIYRPPLDVEMLCLRWALWLYKEPDQRGFASPPGGLLGAVGSLRRVGAGS